VRGAPGNGCPYRDVRRKHRTALLVAVPVPSLPRFPGTVSGYSPLSLLILQFAQEKQVLDYAHSIVALYESLQIYNM
jgi:hypothetical protein